MMNGFESPHSALPASGEAAASYVEQLGQPGLAIGFKRQARDRRGRFAGGGGFSSSGGGYHEAPYGQALSNKKVGSFFSKVKKGNAVTVRSLVSDGKGGSKPGSASVFRADKITSTSISGPSFSSGSPLFGTGRGFTGPVKRISKSGSYSKLQVERTLGQGGSVG